MVCPREDMLWPVLDSPGEDVDPRVFGQVGWSSPQRWMLTSLEYRDARVGFSFSFAFRLGRWTLGITHHVALGLCMIVVEAPVWDGVMFIFMSNRVVMCAFQV